MICYAGLPLRPWLTSFLLGPDLEFKCPPNRFLCGGTKLCLELGQLCDGVVDCPDAMDEGAQCSV